MLERPKTNMPQTPSGTPTTTATRPESSGRVSVLQKRAEVYALKVQPPDGSDPTLLEASALNLRDLISEGYVPSSHATAWLQRQEALRDQLTAAATDTRPLVEEPRLLDYQTAGVRFILRSKHTLLGDTTGAGKTVQVLAAARIAKATRIVVAAPRFLHLKWAQEVMEWYPEAAPLVYESTIKRNNFLKDFDLNDDLPQPVVLIVTGKALKNENIKRVKWDWFVYDESSAVRNRGTQLAHAATGIQANYKTLITATGQDSLPSELWSLLHVLEPQRFTSYWRFANQFVDFDVARGRGGMQIKVPRGVNKRNLPYLHDILSLYLLRRSRADVGFDEPQEETIPVEMEPTQREVYERVAHETVVSLTDGTDVVILNEMSRLMPLRRICVSPHLFDDSFPEMSGKIRVAVEYAQLHSDEQLLVFCSFRPGVESLCKQMQLVKISAAFIHGGLTDTTIETEIARFQQGHTRVLVTTPAIGGFGHNLQNSRRLLLVDRPYSRLQVQQLIGRLIRHGGEGTVTVSSLACIDSIDQDIELLHGDKQARFDDVYVARKVLANLLAKYASGTRITGRSAKQACGKPKVVIKFKKER
jgi:SNF2 family DNA or RNA helicase